MDTRGAIARTLWREAAVRQAKLGLDPQGISSQPEEVAAYLADPLVHGRATMRWGAEILRTMVETRRFSSLSHWDQHTRVPEAPKHPLGGSFATCGSGTSVISQRCVSVLQ